VVLQNIDDNENVSLPISCNYMKFCPVVLEIRRGHVHVAKKERRIIIIIIIRRRRNGAKTITLQTTFGRLSYQHEQI
jgi:hypothetical protein